MDDKIETPSLINNAIIPAYKKSFFGICERAFYHEIDRQNQLQQRIAALTTFTTALCVAAWFFSSYEYLYHADFVLYNILFAATWLALFVGIGCIALSAVYRTIKTPAGMNKWNDWVNSLENSDWANGLQSIRAYSAEQTVSLIEIEIISAMSKKMSEAQSKYAESNEKRYRLLRYGQLCMITALVLVLLLCAVKTNIDYKASNSGETTNMSVPPPLPSPPPCPDKDKDTTGGGK